MIGQKSATKNYLYNLTYQIFSLFVPLVTTPYISRVLGANLIGIYSYTSSIVSYFTLVAALGINMYGQREIAYCRGLKEKESIVFWKIFYIKLVTVLFAMITYIFFLLFYKKYQTVFSIQIITILAVFFDVTWFYQGKENFQIIAIRNILVKLICAIAIFIFVKETNDFNVYVFINVLSVFVSNVLLCLGIPSQICKVSFSKINSMESIKPILEFFIPIIAVQIYSVLDKTMIGALASNTSENGYYEQTQKIINIGMAIVTSIGPVLYPSVSRLYAENRFQYAKKIVEKSFRLVFLISCPIAFGIMGIAKNFVPVFFGEGFEPVIKLLYIYAFVIFFIPVSNVAGYVVLNPTKQQNKATLAVIIGAIVNFTLNMFLIPRYYSMGAAIATVIAEVIVSVFHMYFVRSYISIRNSILEWTKHFFSSFIMFICVVWLGKFLVFVGFDIIFTIVIQIVVGIIVYVAIIGVFVDRDIIFSSYNRIMKKYFLK